MSLGDDGGKVLVVDDSPATADRIKSILSPRHTVDLEPEPQEGLFRAAEGDYDLAIISLNLRQIDGLRLCSHLRSLDRTRLLPILVVVDPEDNVRLLRGLDLGSTTISCDRSTATKCWHECARRFAANDSPIACATTCR